MAANRQRSCLEPPNELAELRTLFGSGGLRAALARDARASLTTDGHCSVAMLKA
jgi:hypothetical protein